MHYICLYVVFCLSLYKYKETKTNKKMDIISFSKHILDHRIERNQIHSVETIVFIAVSAVICGAESWNEIELFGRTKESYFRDRLSKFNGIPSHDTFNRFFSAIDVDYFERQFRYWVHQLCGKYKGIVAIDGKTIRTNSTSGLERKPGKGKLHMVSAFAASNGISMGQVKVDDKSNEITAIPDLLEALDLTECIVTIDAMGCQKKIAKKIIEEKADYVLAVKANQGSLYNDLISQFESGDKLMKSGRNLPSSRWAFYTTQEKAHSYQEVRRCVAYNNGLMKNLFKGWEAIQTIARVELERTHLHTGEVFTDRRYYICSLPLDAKAIAEAIRTHWSIENKLHWQLDVSFREDFSRKTKNAAINYSLMCKMVLGLLKNDDKKASIKAKRKVAGWDQQYLDKLLRINKI